MPFSRLSFFFLYLSRDEGGAFVIQRHRRGGGQGSDVVIVTFEMVPINRLLIPERQTCNTERDSGANISKSLDFTLFQSKQAISSTL